MKLALSVGTCPIYIQPSLLKQFTKQKIHLGLHIIYFDYKV